MSKFASKYAIELVTSTGVLLADLTGRAQQRRLTMSRNEAEDISWVVDLNEFEHYCRLINVDPLNVLVNGSTEVRIKRLGKYLCGGQLIYFEPRIDSSSQTILIRATGFLNLFKDRYTSVLRQFTATQATTIARTLIDETQALANGSFGITIGTLATVGVHDRTYKRTNLKDALQALTKVQTAPFDFEFTYDKTFNTYAQLGSQRPEIIFEYPNNIKQISVPNDASGTANEIIALGSGFGIESQATATVDSAGSQATYKLRQKIITSNGTDNSDNGLTDAANAELATWAFPFELPDITVNGNVAPFITDYRIGDRVRIKINGYSMLNHVNNFYRIEKIELDVDEADNESIRLFVSG